MPRALEFTTTVSEDAKLPKTRRRQVRDYLELYKGEEIHCKFGKPRRSNRANRYYWSCVISPIHEAMIDAGVAFMETNDGIKMVTAEAIHTLFKHKYLEPQAVVLFGDDVTLPPTTTTLDSTQFSDYIERIKTDPQVRQLAVHFPEPEDSYKSYKIEDLPY